MDLEGLAHADGEVGELASRLVKPAGRLAEIHARRSPPWRFMQQGDAGDKPYDEGAYPRMTLRVSQSEGAAFLALATDSPAALLAKATTPLEKVAILMAWKNADLQKLRHIARGLAAQLGVSGGVSDGDDGTLHEGPVFQQFGRHVAHPTGQPIADQHTYRAMSFIAGPTSLCVLRASALASRHVEEYLEWWGGLAWPATRDADQVRDFDIAMFEFGRCLLALQRLACPRKTRRKPKSA